MTRIYQDVSLYPDTLIELNAQASHHVARVLRMQVNDAVMLFNAKGEEYSGVIDNIDKKRVVVKLQTKMNRQTESHLDIWLVQGISRGEKMDYIIQKAVELGVNHIVPLLTERCQVKLDGERREKRLQHWQSVAISACEQSGRNRVPEMYSPQTWQTVFSYVKTDYFFVLSPDAKETLKTFSISPSARIALLIGPEGGLSEQEIQNATNQGCFPVRLGPRTLRTETAGLAAITAFQCYFGDMG